MKVSDDELLSVLREMRTAYPEWRFGQLIANLSTWAKGPDKNGVWDVEDSELIETAHRHLRRRKGSDV